MNDSKFDNMNVEVEIIVFVVEKKGCKQNKRKIIILYNRVGYLYIFLRNDGKRNKFLIFFDYR